MAKFTLQGTFRVERTARITVEATDLAAAKLAALAAIKVPDAASPVWVLTETYINGTAVLTGHVREVVDAV